MKSIFISVAVLLFGVSGALAASPPASAPDAKPAAAAPASAPAMTETMAFLQTAAVADQFEIQTSKLVDRRSSNGGVKALSKMLIKDHTKTGQDMRSVVTSQKLTMPSNTLDTVHQKQFDKLQALKGADFDTQFLATQLDAHRDAVTLFESYSENGDNAAVKSFAKRTLPTLQKHLVQVKKLQSVTLTIAGSGGTQNR